MNFAEFFVSEIAPYKGSSVRDKFLSRVFGIFNEQIIRTWCDNSKSPFQDLGRPSVYDLDGKGYTLDFLFKDRSGKCFLGEMKCELEYQKYKYITLTGSEQLQHHEKRRAFQLFLETAKNPADYAIKCKGKKVSVDGSALVWGATSKSGTEEVKNMYGVSYIISTEEVISDLIKWEDKNYLNLINSHKKWSLELFSELAGEIHEK